MLSPWAMLRSLFARVGSDPYYSSYERSLGNIKAEVDRLQVGAACCGWLLGSGCVGYRQHGWPPPAPCPQQHMPVPKR